MLVQVLVYHLKTVPSKSLPRNGAFLIGVGEGDSL